MLCSCLYIQRWKRRLQMLVAVDPTSTHEITTPVFRPSSWMNPNFSNGHSFRILSYGRDVTKGNKNSMKISVLSTHHPSTAVLSWLPVPFGWRRETKNSMKNASCPGIIHPLLCVRSCGVLVHTSHLPRRRQMCFVEAGASDTPDSSADDSPLSDASKSHSWLNKKPTSLFTECYNI